MNNTLICTVLLVLPYEKIRLALRLLTAQQKDAGETLVMDDVIIAFNTKAKIRHFWGNVCPHETI